MGTNLKKMKRIGQFESDIHYEKCSNCKQRRTHGGNIYLYTQYIVQDDTSGKHCPPQHTTTGPLEFIIFVVVNITCYEKKKKNTSTIPTKGTCLFSCHGVLMVVSKWARASPAEHRPRRRRCSDTVTSGNFFDIFSPPSSAETRSIVTRIVRVSMPH